MIEKLGGRGTEKERTSRRPPSREGGALRKMLTANLVFLVGLATISFFLPLSDFQRWFVLSAVAVLAAVDWTAVERLQKG